MWHEEPASDIQRLSHEGDREVLAVSNLLHRELHHRMAIGHGEDVGVTDVHLVLHAATHPLNSRQGCRKRPVGGEPLRCNALAGALQQVIVLDVPAGRGEVLITRRPWR